MIRQGCIRMNSPRQPAQNWHRFASGSPPLLMLATALVLQAHSRNEYFPPRSPLASLPSQIDGWTGTDETSIRKLSTSWAPANF